MQVHRPNLIEQVAVRAIHALKNCLHYRHIIAHRAHVSEQLPWLAGDQRKIRRLITHGGTPANGGFVKSQLQLALLARQSRDRIGQIPPLAPGVVGGHQRLIGLAHVDRDVAGHLAKPRRRARHDAGRAD